MWKGRGAGECGRGKGKKGGECGMREGGGEEGWGIG